MPDVLDLELQFFEMADDLIRLSGADRTTIRAVGRALRSTGQFEEVVDGMDTVTLQFDPLQLSLADVQALIGQATQSASDHEEASAEIIELEAVFSEDAAPDLDLVANTLDLSKDQIIEDLCAAELRVEMRVEIARLHNEIGATMIYVTHDQVEAMTLADKIVVLRAGRIEQVGKPLDLYNDPDNQFVAGFIGSPAMNFFPAMAGEGGVTVPGLGNMTLPAPASAPASGPLTVGVRPQQLRLAEGDSHTVDISEQLGGVAYHYLHAADGTRVTVEAHEQTQPASGSKVGLTVDPENALFFAADSGLRLR